MKDQKDLEFINDDTLAGFRLVRFEIYNWGTFHDKVWTLTADGRNVLVTGDIGSGKTTLVDAITTLLVPANRIAYNKAAGAETRERSLRSYVQGYFKAERGEAGYSARPVPLRNQNCYSVILGVFTNAGYGQTITLAQVFWFRELSGQPERFYLVADSGLSIANDFADFGSDIKDLKKKLRDIPQLDDIYDSFPPYAASFRRRFGIDNEQALELFLQTVSMKTVGNLTEFVRSHMLEAFDTEARIKALIAHFDDLNRAHNAVLRAKEQIDRLTPVIADLDRHKEVSGLRENLRGCRDFLRLYFAYIKTSLLEKRISGLEEEQRKEDARIQRLNEQLSGHQSERDKLRQAIAENGGDRLERLKNDISLLTEKKLARLGKSEDYENHAKEASIAFDGTMESFLGNRQTIVLEQELANKREAEFQNKRVEAEVEFKQLRDSYQAIAGELDSLKRRKSNIDSSQIRIRSELCGSLGIDEDLMPFAGELLQVRKEESRWEGAVERLLRNFGLSLLVPERHYASVSEWVDRTNCRGRIVYYKVPAKWTESISELHPDSLVHKLSVKKESEFSPWIRSELARRFDYACCEDIAGFRREKQAITMSGQIKGTGNRHEKDDRHSIGERSRYVLGWSNESKIRLLESRRVEMEEKIAGAGKEIARLEIEQKKSGERRMLLVRLDGFKSWEELDWKPVALRIEEMEQEKKDLEAASDILKTLSWQLSQLEAEMKKTLAGLDIEKDARSRNEEKKSNAEQLLGQCNEAISSADKSGYGEISAKLDDYRKEALGEHQLSVESADNREREMREWLQVKIDSEDRKLKTLEERIIKNMQDYTREYPSETTDVDAGLESENEFRLMLDGLKSDDLPKFESRFKALLNENTIREIANFQSQLSRERQEIRERIERINKSLSGIDYNKGRYIILEALESPDVEVRDFRQQLRACTEGSLTGSDDEQYAERKFLEVREIIKRFQGREGLADSDRKWTRKVTDVRKWFAFAASERWKEDNTEYEHYTDSGGKSGGQKEKLAYTVLAASLAYQFGLEWNEVRSRSFRFVVIDEAFGRSSEESTRYALDLFRKLNLQFLIVTPLQKIHIIEPYVSGVGFVDCVEKADGSESRIRNLTIEEYRKEKDETAA